MSLIAHPTFEGTRFPPLCSKHPLHSQPCPVCWNKKTALPRKMKVLCEYADCGPSYVRTGWGRVFTALGHEFTFWRPEVKPALDVFAEVEPDIFLGTTYGLTRAVVKAMTRRPHVRVALCCSAWGPLAETVPEEYPITRVTLAEKKAVEDLKKKTGRPDVVFSHVTDRYLDALLGGWREVGVEPAGLLNAADTFAYLGGTRSEEFACDVAFVGGWWPYKARNLAPYMLPLCHPSSGLKVKVFGNQPWPVAQYLGLLDDPDQKDVFASATVCPNVSEPHSTELGYDLVERLYKIPVAGGFVVSDYVEEGNEVFGTDVIPMASTPREFHEVVRHFVSHPNDRLPYMEKARRVVLENHTYFHRVAQMFTLLELNYEAARCLELHASLFLCN